MKLNYDCIRDILLVIEETTTYNQDFTLSNHQEELSKYTLEELQYHLRQCDLAGFLHKYQYNMDGDVSVIDLSFQGHEFLNTVRPKTVWENTKTICSKLGITTVSSLSQIASQIISQIISKQLGY